MPNKQFLIPTESGAGGGGGSSGTVTSVTFTGDGTVLSSTPSSAVTTSGTLTAATATQSGNTVIASPANGSSGVLTARALVAADLPISSGANTSGGGFFWGGVGPSGVEPLAVTSNVSGWAANQSYCYMFYLPLSITITKATIGIQAVSASASKFASVGLYSLAGVKLFDSGTFNVSTGQSAGSKTNTVAAVAFQPGFYYFMHTTNATDVNVFYFGADSAGGGAVFSANGSRTASVAATTNGAQNASLGTLSTASSATAPWICLFEP